MAFNRRIGYVIGIDPDISRNGLAIISKSRRELEVYYTNFPETLEKVKEVTSNHVFKF